MIDIRYGTHAPPSPFHFVAVGAGGLLLLLLLLLLFLLTRTTTVMMTAITTTMPTPMPRQIHFFLLVAIALSTPLPRWVLAVSISRSTLEALSSTCMILGSSRTTCSAICSKRVRSSMSVDSMRWISACRSRTAALTEWASRLRPLERSCWLPSLLARGGYSGGKIEGGGLQLD